jgi:PPOX class probable F420-dependent enzyme
VPPNPGLEFRIEKNRCGPVNDNLRPFWGQKYLNLESYRRNGRSVRTPLWFVEMDGRLYVRTPDDAWKVKRVRHTPRVRIAVCNMRGVPKSEWMNATARIAEGDEAERANRLLARKYGILKRLIDWGTWLRRRGHVVIAIEG